MSYLIPFDRAVDERCGRLSVADRAKTGYYRKSDMDKAYNELYMNPNIQSRFGGGVSKMKTNPEDVFMKSAMGGGTTSGGSVGDVLPPRFLARRYNLGTSVGSMSMFSQSEYGEVDMSADSLADGSEDRMRGLNMADVESQISAGNAYWDNMRNFPTQSEEDFYDGEAERFNDEREQEQHERFLDDTTYVRAEDAMIADVPRLRNIQDRGHMDIELRTRLWTYDQRPEGREELLTGLPPVHSSARPVALYQPPPAIRTINEQVPNQAVPPEDAINEQPRPTF